jgi:hypothetical protein
MWIKNRLMGVVYLFSIVAVLLSNSVNMIQESKSERKSLRTEWTLSDFILKSAEGVQIIGNPEIVKFKSGNAVSFNGSSDAVFLDSMPFAGYKNFTVEIIFRPSGGGSFEQRFLHCGEVQGDRVLLELRSTTADWYFDAFIKSGEAQLALIEPRFLHPLDQWYHIAYVIENGKLSTFVNSIMELEGNIEMTPLKSGKTSIGVRQNGISWFKGAIYKIRITPEALEPKDFIDYKKVK